MATDGRMTAAQGEWWAGWEESAHGKASKQRCAAAAHRAAADATRVMSCASKKTATGRETQPGEVVALLCSCALALRMQASA